MNSWEQYQQLVLHELKEHKSELVNIRKEIQTLHIDIAGLKVKSSVWGLMGGMIPAIITFIYMLAK